MKKLLISFLLITLMFAAMGPSLAQAGAYETPFVTSITYQNIGSSATTSLSILFYETPDDTTPIVVGRPNLAAGAGTSVYVGGLSAVPDGFQGSAVMSSDQPLVATLVQIPQNNPAVKARPLSNGFTSGTPVSLVATVLKATTVYSLVSVQNAGSTDTTATVKFYAAGSPTMTTSRSQLLKPGAGFTVDAATVTDLPTPFSGSAVVDTNNNGSLVSSVMELDTGSGVAAKAFEGLGQGSNTFYMPSALCVIGGQVSYYAVQNTSTSATANVTVTYNTGQTQTANIPPNSKASFDTCATLNLVKPFGGSAVITSVGAPIIAIGKVAGAGISTAHVGVSQGSQKLALPYVRWGDGAQYFSQGLQRTFIAIQNVGSGSIASGTILVKFINPDGSIAGTYTHNSALAQYGKFSVNATNAGLTTFGYPNGGGAVIEGPNGSQLAAVARVVSYIASGNEPGEDYNGIPMP